MILFHLAGFGADIREKVERLSDIALGLYSTPLLSRRLALYGGTCLNHLHLVGAPGLGLDLDFDLGEVDVGTYMSGTNL